MEIVERGSGTPLILVPGLQGRWQYVQPALDALAVFFRVLTFSLAGERSSGAEFDAARGLDNYTAQIFDVLRQADIDRAMVCGISFGGLAALRFASAHPDRTTGLVLASTPGPGWHLRRRHALYARLPYLFGPLFLAETPRRLRKELTRALPERRHRRRFTRSQLRLLLSAPLSLSAMAKRALLISPEQLVADARRVRVPTLIVTGERGLDHVVPVDGSMEYSRLIPGARTALIEHSGHLGTITRPEAFAAIVRGFAASLVTPATNNDAA